MRIRSFSLFPHDDDPAPVDRPARPVETRSHLANFLNRQKAWARRRGYPLVGSDGPGGVGDPTYLTSLDRNLVEPMSEAHRRQFQSGSGGELNGKAKALHSSSMACYNFWGYWTNRDLLDVPCRALDLPTGGTDGRFEHQLGIVPSRPPANVDFTYITRTTLVGVEAKLTEPLGRAHLGLKPVYLEHAHLWDGIPTLRSLARQLCPDDRSYALAHPAQLIKHTLGMHLATGGTKRFRLCVLFYDHGIPEMVHELRDLQRYWTADGLVLQWGTYQSAIARICRDHWDTHRSWTEFCSERYL